jgi:hypothetical protein
MRLDASSNNVLDDDIDAGHGKNQKADLSRDKRLT